MRRQLFHGDHVTIAGYDFVYCGDGVFRAAEPIPYDPDYSEKLWKDSTWRAALPSPSTSAQLEEICKHYVNS